MAQKEGVVVRHPEHGPNGIFAGFSGTGDIAVTKGISKRIARNKNSPLCSLAIFFSPIPPQDEAPSRSFPHVGLTVYRRASQRIYQE